VTDNRTVLLVVNPGRDEANETARKIGKALDSNGIGLRVLATEAIGLGVGTEAVDGDRHAADGCELVLVLGGDGTFLRAAELARNAGRIGLCEFDAAIPMKCSSVTRQHMA
jgi:NAD+ kinase